MTEEMLDPRRERPMMCDLCGRLLTRVKAPDGTRSYFHPEHDPVPVPMPETGPRMMRCDFCGDDVGGENAQAVFTDPFTITIGNQRHKMSSFWAACPDCAGLIDKGWWKVLAVRAHGRWFVKNEGIPMEDGQARLLDVLFKAVRKHLIMVRPHRLTDFYDDMFDGGEQA